jgi:hypothetical protein
MTRNACRRLLAATLLALGLAACGSNVNEKTFARIADGMTEQQVIDLLGTPSKSASTGALGVSGTTATWTDDGVTISVQFVNGKVWLKQLDRAKP